MDINNVNTRELAHEIYLAVRNLRWENAEKSVVLLAIEDLIKREFTKK